MTTLPAAPSSPESAGARGEGASSAPACAEGAPSRPRNQCQTPNCEQRAEPESDHCLACQLDGVRLLCTRCNKGLRMWNRRICRYCYNARLLERRRQCGRSPDRTRATRSLTEGRCVLLRCDDGHEQVVGHEQVDRIAGTPCHVCGQVLEVVGDRQENGAAA